MTKLGSVESEPIPSRALRTARPTIAAWTFSRPHVTRPSPPSGIRSCGRERFTGYGVMGCRSAADAIWRCGTYASPVAPNRGRSIRSAGKPAREETDTMEWAWLQALSANIRYAARPHAGVAYPGSVDVARQSVDVLRRVRGADWRPGAGRPMQRDLAHAAYGFQRIPPSWRFRRRERAATAAVPWLVLCRHHRSRRHHRTNLGLALAVRDPANDAAAGPVSAITLPVERNIQISPEQHPPSSLLTVAINVREYPVRQPRLCYHPHNRTYTADLKGIFPGNGQMAS